jgi:hypothetical protein
MVPEPTREMEDPAAVYPVGGSAVSKDGLVARFTVGVSVDAVIKFSAVPAVANVTSTGLHLVKRCKDCLVEGSSSQKLAE